MTEKKLIVEALRLNYSGMFNLQEFFDELDNWTDENGFERENKKKLEHVESDHKKLEYMFELWKSVTDYAKAIVKIKVLFNDVVDFEIERNGHKRMMQKGHALIVIDGFLETDYEHRWQQKPWFVFMRTFIDKFVWRVWMDKHDGVVAGGCTSLFNRLMSYFKKYKH